MVFGPKEAEVGKVAIAAGAFAIGRCVFDGPGIIYKRDLLYEEKSPVSLESDIPISYSKPCTLPNIYNHLETKPKPPLSNLNP